MVIAPEPRWRGRRQAIAMSPIYVMCGLAVVANLMKAVLQTRFESRWLVIIICSRGSPSPR